MTMHIRKCQWIACMKGIPYHWGMTPVPSSAKKHFYFSEARYLFQLTLCAFYFQYLLLYNFKLGSMCSKYEKLVKLAGTELKPHVYSMITFLQVSEAFYENSLSAC